MTTNNTNHATQPQVSLDHIRDELSAIDSQLLELYKQREELSLAVWDAKKEMDKAIYDPKQEEVKLSRTLKEEPEDKKGRLRSFYRTLFRLSRGAQYEAAYNDQVNWPLGSDLIQARHRELTFNTLACQGTVGSYSSQAAQHLYPDANLINITSFEGATNQVMDGNVDAAVLPIENSTAGTVDDVFRLINSKKLYVVDAIDLNIRHHLVAVPGTKLSQITRVMSHSQALSQCSAVLKSMGWVTETISNTAFAAREVARLGKHNVAAIASEKAAEAYGLEVLMSEISNYYVNQTRFAVVSRLPVVRPTATHVSLQFSLSHQSGSLSHTLAVFADLGLNMTKLQSRPIANRPWEYRFSLEFAGTPDDPRVERALLQLSSELPDFRFTGWYEEHHPQDAKSSV